MTKTATKLPTRADFLEELNSTFRMYPADGEPFDTELVKLDVGVSNSIQESFALLFLAPADAPQVQHIYRLEHEKLGSMDLFLVPVDKDEKGLYYESIFNNLVI